MRTFRKKVVFIAHPLSGDIKGNVNKVLRICRDLHTREIIPCAPYLAALHYLDDTVIEHREIGIEANLECFRRKFIDELWLFGDRISPGMWQEILLAREMGIPIVARTEETRHAVRALADDDGLAPRIWKYAAIAVTICFGLWACTGFYV